MSELLNAFKTTAGKTFKKVADKNGVTRYFADGKPVGVKAWAGANRSLEHVITDVDGEMPAEIREADTAGDLEQATGIPFTNDFFEPVIDGTTKEERLRAEGNRFLSFWTRNDHLDRDEAAKEYIEFRNELRDVEDPEARAIIKSRYNVGGS